MNYRLCLLCAISSAAWCAQRPYLTEPCLSPNRKEIAFVSGGDIWTVPASGGEARLLISHPATESKPLYSPDGTKLAFVSTRTGNGDIYVLTLASGELKQLTFDDAMDQLDAWSRDGKFLYFTTSAHDIGAMNDVFRVRAEAGTPMPVTADRFANEFFSAPAPNGIDMAFAARGISSAQWWRKGHSHLDESEIYIRHEGSPATYQQIGDGEAKELWPMWSADGRKLYYMSDRGGTENIWEFASGVKRQVTKFNEGRLLWPTISYDGKTILFEHNFEIWQVDTAGGETKKVTIELRGMPSGPLQTHLSLTDGFTDMQLSKDGKKLAFVNHGQVFAGSSKETGSAFRVTQTATNERGAQWSPDNNRVIYVSDRDGVDHLYEYDFRTNKERQLTKGAEPDDRPLWSPDGKWIAYIHAIKELRLLDPASGADKLLVEGYFARQFSEPSLPQSWSPDSKWIAYIGRDDRYFSNIMIIAREGGKPQAASFLGNVFGGTPVWSPDGSYLFFATAQRTEPNNIARIDLVPKTPLFREDRFRELFKDSPVKKETGDTTPENKPASTEGEKKRDIRIVFDGIRERITLLPIGLDVTNPLISPDGKTLLVTAANANQTNLYTYSLDELASEPAIAKQLTSTPGAKTRAQWSADGKEVYFLEGGKPTTIAVETRAPKALAVNAELDIDFGKEKMEVFQQAWSDLNEGFYDAEFHGVNWSAMRELYAPLIEGARTPDEVRRVIGMMIGELNSSHSGISAALGDREAPLTGRIGVEFDRKAYENVGELRVSEVLDLSPAALAGIHVGDVITAVDGKSIAATANFDELLRYKVNRRTLFTVNGKDVVLRPVNLATVKGLRYRQWVEEKRAYVNKISNGRLGYVHMQDMSADSLQRLALDLDAENRSKEGVVVDVRNNNGGFVNAYALDVLSRRGYLNMTFRGFKKAPARTILGQRSLELPTILVTNQHSLSDAEDFTEGYRALQLGEVVGEPTAGWIIYTGATQLIDGSNLRMPSIRITTADGKDMEGHPRPVDTLVVRPIGESFTGRDVQLETAVAHLLKKTAVREEAR
jgi:Tol biopolymer transport system component/C-terminal processing protease CtpA/Prc